MTSTNQRRTTRVAALLVVLTIVVAPQAAVVMAADPSPSIPSASPSPVAAASPQALAVYVSPGTRIPAFDETSAVTLTLAEAPEYAGRWLYTDREDRDRRYTPVFMWKGDIDGVVAQLTEALGEDAAFEVHQAQRSKSDLDAIVEQIRALYPEFYARDMLIVSIGRDTRSNLIEVGVQGPLDVAQEFLAPLGDAVVVKAEEVSTFDDDGGASASPAVFVSPGTEGSALEDMWEAMRPLTTADEYAGYFLGPKDDGTYESFLMWKGDLDVPVARLSEVLGTDAAFEVRQAERSWAELEAIAKQVRALYPKVYARGLLPVSLEYDTQRNRLVLGVEGPVNKVRKLMARFGDAVVVRQRQVSTFD